MAEQSRSESDAQTFTAPILGMTFASLVVVTVVAILDSSLGSGLEKHVDAPARTMVAVPVILLAVVVFVACTVALMVPGSRRDSMRVAEVAGWLIPSWLVMAAMVLGAISFALDQAS